MKTKQNIVQDKLANHELPIDDSFWEEMQVRLQTVKRRKIIPLWWVSGIAAALAALVLLLMPKQEQSQEIADIQQNNIKQNEIPKNSKHSQVIDLQTTGKKVLTQNKTIKLQSKEDIILANENNYIFENQQVEDTVSDDTKVDNENKENDIGKQSQNNKQNDFSELKPLKTLADYEHPVEKIKEKKYQHGLSLALNMSYGSGADDFTKGETQTQYRSPSQPNETRGIATGLDNEKANQSLRDMLLEYPQTTYLPPLSIGVTVRKRLTEFFSVETGLIYTYLNTKFYAGDNHTQQSASLQLHYLGIPLNAVYTFIEHPKWTLYASAGGMIEKGLSYNYQKYILSNNKPENYSGKIERIQLSANGTIGASMILTNTLSVFIEPRISYYFENQQPLSIRTDSPLHLELGAGLRIGF